MHIKNRYNMQELIKITEKKGKKAVSARELYRFLYEDNGHYARWANASIAGNMFAVNGEDFEGFAIVANGNETIDYALTIDFAKRLSMMARSEKGEQARSYFLQCEKNSQSLLPSNYKEALKALLEKVELAEHQALQIEEMTPKADFFDAVTESTDTIDIGSLAKVLNLGIGRTKLFQVLREKKVLMRNNTPFQEYIDRSYFRVVETKFNKPDGSVHINLKTVVFQKGVDGIRKLLMKQV
jgi:anti-repressor protein